MANENENNSKQYISKITLPSGTQYDIKDAQARELIAALGSPLNYKGATTTALEDGDTTNPITIDSKSYTAEAGDVVTYTPGTTGARELEFVFDGTKWQEFGSTGSLKALAFKDNASASYTPAGTVSQPTFTGSASSVTVSVAASESGNYTPAGTVSQPTFSDGAVTASGTFTPNGSVSLTNSNVTADIEIGSGEANYTPAGSVGAPSISLTTAGTTASIHNPTSVTVAKTIAAAAPGATAPDNAVTYYNVSGEVLSLYQLGYTTGDSITTSDVTVKTGDGAYSATAPAFTGTGVHLVTGNISVPSSASFSGTEGNVSVSGTATGTVSQPTFEGTKVAITGTTTAEGSVSQPTFSGTAATITVS